LAIILAQAELFPLFEADDVEAVIKPHLQGARRKAKFSSVSRRGKVKIPKIVTAGLL
jgi:hypothetical protein